MPTEFKLPELGENIETGDIVNVLVSEGDTIDAEQNVFEIETDKAVVEIPCPHAGKIAQIHVGKGDTVKVGQTLLTIEAGDGAPAEAEKAEEEPAAEDKPEAKPSEDEPTPKPAGPAPTEARAAAPPAERPHPSPLPEGEGKATIPAGPAARRVARELGVDLNRIDGSGKRGRITVEDVKAAAQAPAARAPAEAAPERRVEPDQPAPQPVTPPGEPGQDKWGPVRREKMSRIRRTIADQMARSASVIPHVTNFDDADVTDLEALRKGVPKGYLGANIKLTTMPFVLKAVALALRQHPMVNASLDEENNHIVYKQYAHVGVAVDTPRGLVVPVIRDVDRMTIPELARAVASVAERAREVQFAVEDLRGGTFTISNLGAVGGTYSTPIINHPEVAILLLGRSKWMPIVRGEAVDKRLIMPLSLSYDHRVVDGATAARFLNDVIDYLQSPAKLLLTG